MKLYDGGHSVSVNDGPASAERPPLGAVTIYAEGAQIVVNPADQPTLPPWVPAVGTIANVSTNKLNSPVNPAAPAGYGPYPSGGVDPCPARNCKYSLVSGQSELTAWTGLIYAKDYAPLGGTFGSLLITGGGHNNYAGDEVYAYDIEMRQWVRLSTPDPLTYGTNPAGNHADARGEIWADATFTSGKQDAPVSAHMYGYSQYIPAGIGPAGSRGLFVTMTRPASSTIGSSNKQSHKFDLFTNTWSRFAATVCPLGTPMCAGACFDSKRNRIWMTESATPDHLAYLDLATMTWTHLTSSSIGQYYGTLMYAPSYDRIVMMRNHSPSGTPTFVNNIRVVNPANANTAAFKVEVNGTVTGTQPSYDSANAASGGGCDWCEDLPGGPGFVFYHGGAGNIAYACQPTNGASGDFTVWNWTPYTLTPKVGEAPGRQSNVHLRRFVYVPAIRSFLWVAGSGSFVNCWRLFE